MLKADVASNLLWQINSAKMKIGKSILLLKDAGYRVEMTSEGRYTTSGPQEIVTRMNFNLTVMNKIAEVLERHGYTLIVTREGNYALREK